jgi:hypothetical protein
VGVSGRHHWLTRLYPSEWRARYGDEMDELLGGGCGWRDILDVVRSALVERLRHSSGAGVESMQTYPRNVAVLVRKPSAIVPVAMSLGALSVVLLAIANGSAKPQPDEGAAAHIWQILIAGQLPFVGWFALRWLTRDFKAALLVLALQLVAIVAALFPVWYLGL